ncbi:hypothetical protein SAMN06295967_11629 [Belliella buryatensis]|uniref:Lipocalin-like domain-containing protein n=2 Tax=Belliella buryatensis TaxID=1500549 RepID=A0A239GHH4_9BACT|nr:hypothetical protein SAMN06295967_11629 [Belliella buryatensis]
MPKLKHQLFFIILAFIIISCETVDQPPLIYAYSNKIIGEWEQVEKFVLVDSLSNPARNEWLNTEIGYSLKLFEDGTFSYTKFEECTTGSYEYKGTIPVIELTFDCEIEILGVKTSKISEVIITDQSQNNQLQLEHNYGKSTKGCVNECFSIFRRVE